MYVHYGGGGFDTVANLVLQNPSVADFGHVVCNAGDMNGDGYSDIALSAADATITSGFVFVFSGGPQIDGNFDAAVGMSSESRFGWSVSSVGDVNGDGLSDVIIGAYYYAFGDERGYWGIFKGDSTIRVTDVSESGVLPKTMTLYQSYPNPFNPATTIEYRLSKRAFVSLKVYDILGREVRTLVNQQQEVGNYSVKFDGQGLSSGIYFYEIIVTAQDGTVTRETKKMLLLSEREQREEDEHEQLLLTKSRNGDSKAANELNWIQYERTPERLRSFLLTPDQMREAIPDTSATRLFSVFNPHGR